MVSFIGNPKLILFLLVSFFCTTHTIVFAQDLLEDAGTEISLGDSANIFSESISIISRSGKIFILTNSNQLMSKGDFVSLALKDGGPVARAVVAKTHDGQAGIKILKVYSLARWSTMRKGLVVNLIKGDDSSLFKKKKNLDDPDNKDSTIESEEDLFNEKAIVDEDLSDFYKDNRYIKPDNIITAGYSQLVFKNQAHPDGDSVSGNQFNFTWAYQFSDNYWVEGLYGRTSIKGFPSQNTQTIVNNFTARLKFTFKAPLYSYLMPYIGVKSVSVSSPAAGELPSTPTAGDEANAEKELDTIDKLQQTQLAIGVTVLRRLVPGWFLKADLGSDIVSIGFGIEF